MVLSRTGLASMNSLKLDSIPFWSRMVNQSLIVKQPFLAGNLEGSDPEKKWCSSFRTWVCTCEYYSSRHKVYLAAASSYSCVCLFGCVHMCVCLCVCMFVRVPHVCVFMCRRSSNSLCFQHFHLQCEMGSYPAPKRFASMNNKHSSLLFGCRFRKHPKEQNLRKKFSKKLHFM